ncbi:hypothetical protein EZV62_027012 [Acer yangbiense]|uniref:non-specific serine/threonine protein kinase n=1 Tax=Acer yangbiense TaxID=1000413 RepID=A0A5C7GSM6_9ROSI|nr:hypothetical protein EZV62_027012 [Acer yangbiense]
MDIKQASRYSKLESRSNVDDDAHGELNSSALFFEFQLQLHPNEADVVREIAATLGAKLTNPTEDPCQSGILSVTTQTYKTESLIDNNITCNYTDGIFSHVTHIPRNSIVVELISLLLFSSVNCRKLKGMSLQGKLPPELVNLTFLEEIMGFNAIFKENLAYWHRRTGILGEIPVEWGYFANLTYLSLEANHLSGTIPEELGNLVSLTVLILSSNQFVGSLPKKLANLTNLTDFRISDNSFNGSVPEFIGRWTKLKRLEMQSSGLEGTINATIFTLENLNDLRITDMSGPKFDFPKWISKDMNVLVLRNLNMSGSIPKDIWDMVDLETYYKSFHINCGGPNVTINHTVYEGDNDAGNGATLNYDSGTKWGFISAGDFPNDNDKNNNGYIEPADSDTQPELYSEAQILFRDEKPYYRVGRHIFDIYIQGILKWQDFNIKEQANGTGKAIIETFNAMVTENTLEIRLYWAGKGTTVIPIQGISGPLISAISVCRGMLCNSLSALHSIPAVSDTNAVATTECYSRSDVFFDRKRLDLQTVELISLLHFSSLNCRKLKSMSLQGKFPPELANLTFLEEM